MRELSIIVLLILSLPGCSPNNSVQISGRIENGDSIVSIWVGDSIYSFPLDENDFFTGKIPMKKSGYGTLLHNSLNLYLSPGEDLEVYVDNFNFSSSLYFRGSLGGVNNYLKEQEVAVFFDRDDYKLEERPFVEKMQQLIDEKIKLLEAKNFDPSFTDLERERIRYSIAERVSCYPSFRRNAGDEYYVPGKVFTDFLSSFSLNNEALFGTKDYRSFLLNYVYLQGSRGTGGNYSDGVVDYIVSTVTNPTIKDFLLTEIVYRFIWENNGLEGADHLLEVFRRECTDKNKVDYINEIVEHWARLLPGQPAPDFTLKDVHGKYVTLSEYRGDYVYIMVWATWCVPCKSEFYYLDLLQKEYKDEKIKFMTISIDEPEMAQYWYDFLVSKRYSGIHLMIDSDSKFNEDYMIISVPRFILIGTEGEIVDSNAPRPSGQIRQLLDSLIV